METSLFIPAGSYIQLTYSSTINSNNISQTGVLSASLGGFKVTGVQYAVTDNIMTITSLYGSQFNSGTMLVSIVQLNNPPTVQPTTYYLSIFSSTNYLILSSSYVYTAEL